VAIHKEREKMKVRLETQIDCVIGPVKTVVEVEVPEVIDVLDEALYVTLAQASRKVNQVVRADQRDAIASRSEDES